ncbi:MAG: phosphatidate cytidylyltransferase [Spirochaetaceae bacterium]|nr:MAG: phosphatidate cytidylyltransferase [Spirochaetaceae bacterium]
MEQIVVVQKRNTLSGELRTELIRKSVHVLVATVPGLAVLLGTPVTLMLLASGTLLYTYAEARRRQGFSIPIITRITELSSRSRDLDSFVLGPITLGIGAMLALLLYPHPAASIAIYALAFGDGIASVVGKLFGRLEIPLTGGKTLEGSLACMSAVAVSAFLVVPSASTAIAVAATAALLEVLPTYDADNLVLPVGVGLTVTLIL